MICFQMSGRSLSKTCRGHKARLRGGRKSLSQFGMLFDYCAFKVWANPVLSINSGSSGIADGREPSRCRYMIGRRDQCVLRYDRLILDL